MPLQHHKPNGVMGMRALSTSGLDVNSLPSSIQNYIQEQVKVCRPESVHVCDGTEAENHALLDKLEKDGRIQKLPKYENW